MAASDPVTSAAPSDARDLVAELRSRIEGEVRFDPGTRALYATDGSNYRQVPIGVVIPRTVDDVVETVAVCREAGAPVLPRGAGTSLAGQCCNVAVVIDHSKSIHDIVDLDPEARRARVRPGVIRDVFDRAASRHGLTFGPDTATHEYATLGGMIGNNACGVHSVMAGKTEENTEELEVLTYDGLRLRVGATADDELERIIAAGGRRGQIYAGLKDIRDRYADLIRDRYPDIPRRVSGYNLPQLLPENGFHVARALVGTEGTCVTYLEASVRLVPSPPARSLLVLGYPDVYAAADDVPEVMAHEPIGLEGIDEMLVRDMKRKGIHPRDVDLLPDGAGWLLVEFGGGDRAESDAHARKLMRALDKRTSAPSMRLFDQPDLERKVWEIRESALGATARVPDQPDTWEGWEDAAVPPERLGPYLRDLRALYGRYDYIGSLYGHFGQGCIHTRINFDLRTPSGVQRFRSFVDEAADLVLSYGGSLSGEHGDGQSRAELLPKMFGPDLVRAFEEFKALWDPDGRMNPGKVVRPNPITANLQMGPGALPWTPATHFAYPNDDGRLLRATERCVGVGKCRRLGGGIMCPSFMVTREEQHSTRGRAHLLFEMLQGHTVTDGWRSEAVRESLDLCLSCKGCRAECPVNVDVATYKAEFLSHHYRGRLRPRAAFSMGLIHWWARLGSAAPGLANAVLRAPVLSAALKRAGGVAPDRAAPPLARETFRRWFHRRSPDLGNRPVVLLWPDTFTTYFQPEPAKAAVAVLEDAGFRVEIPNAVLCCGRPLYDHGMLGLARRVLRRTLRTLGPYIRNGVPMVGVEPSCLAVFRDELVNLFPEDPAARRLSERSFLLSEFLEEHAGEYRPPIVERKALVQAHCHHASVMGFEAERSLMERMGLEAEVLDSGCCGMAGSFGFEAGRKFEVSQRVGERALLPRIREAPDGMLVIADGFSCRTMIEQNTGRKTRHLAEVLAAAIPSRAAE